MSDIVARSLCLPRTPYACFLDRRSALLFLTAGIAFWVLQKKVSRPKPDELQSLLLFSLSTGLYELGGIEFHLARRPGYTRPNSRFYLSWTWIFCHITIG